VVYHIIKDGDSVVVTSNVKVLFAIEESSISFLLNFAVKKGKVKNETYR